MNWFAVYVQSRREKLVASMLTMKGFETSLPLSLSIRNWCDRRKQVEEPIFPGYVFCHFDPNVRTPILRTAGVVSILGAGKEAIPLEPEEISALKCLEQAKVPVEPWPFIQTGQWVYIEDGPLKGLSGVVTECKKHVRVIVSVALLHRSVAVEINRSQIRPTNAPKASVTRCVSV